MPMSKLITLTKDTDKQLLDELFENELTAYEDVQGSKLYVSWNGSQFIIKPKSLSAEPINQIDLALQYYYNKAVNFFNSFDDRVKSLMPKKWHFIFEYFPDENPVNIEYQRMPKNGLVLTGICKGNKYEYTLDELMEFSRLFNVDHLPVIFQGNLNQDQIQAIKYFLNTSSDDLEFVFGEQSFNIDEIKIKEPKRDLAYISLICKLFNIYMTDAKDDILDFQFSIPDFFDKEKFKINIELINNKATKEFLMEDAKLEYIFKIVLGSFNRKKKKPIGVFNDSTLNLFNTFVDKINQVIDLSLRKNTEISLSKSGLLDFQDFFEIEYAVDGEKNVYPDVYNEFEAPSSKKKKGVV